MVGDDYDIFNGKFLVITISQKNNRKKFNLVYSLFIVSCVCFLAGVCVFAEKGTVSKVF